MSRYAVVIPRLPDYPHSHAFDEIALALVEGLNALGHDAIHSDRAQHSERRAIVLAPQLLPLCGLAVPDDAILYNLEQIDRSSSWITPEVLALFRRHALWDYSERNRAVLAQQHGIDHAALMPVGHSLGLERIIAAPVADIDVLFYGSPNDRRIAVLESLARFLASRCIRCSASTAVTGTAGSRAQRSYSTSTSTTLKYSNRSAFPTCSRMPVSWCLKMAMRKPKPSGRAVWCSQTMCSWSTPA
ncbi:MAG: hypothetical protein IPH50_03140 [Rhodanobacteraceae bacterium]|nr:hypothetical protein [Rhodanobacteraceae bacterium]